MKAQKLVTDLPVVTVHLLDLPPGVEVRRDHDKTLYLWDGRNHVYLGKPDIPEGHVKAALRNMGYG